MATLPPMLLSTWASSEVNLDKSDTTHICGCNKPARSPYSRRPGLQWKMNGPIWLQGVSIQLQCLVKTLAYLPGGITAGFTGIPWILERILRNYNIGDIYSHRILPVLYCL